MWPLACVAFENSDQATSTAPLGEVLGFQRSLVSWNGYFKAEPWIEVLEDPCGPGLSPLDALWPVDLPSVKLFRDWGWLSPQVSFRRKAMFKATWRCQTSWLIRNSYAKIIDIIRRGCPVGWEPPEIAHEVKFCKPRICEIADANTRVEGGTNERDQGAQEEKYVHTDIWVQLMMVETKVRWRMSIKGSEPVRT